MLSQLNLVSRSIGGIEMEFHKEITNHDGSISDGIYNYELADSLFNSGKIGARKLSLMKQENIRLSIKKNTLATLIWIVKRKCGYCFKYMDIGCYTCPLSKKNKLDCDILDEFNLIKGAKTKKQFSNAHKAWCKNWGYGKMTGNKSRLTVAELRGIGGFGQTQAPALIGDFPVVEVEYKDEWISNEEYLKIIGKVN